MAGMAVLVSKCLHFSVRNLFGGDEEYFILRKGTVYQEETAVFLIGTYLVTRPKLRSLKREIYKCVGNFSTSLC